MIIIKKTMLVFLLTSLMINGGFAKNKPSNTSTSTWKKLKISSSNNTKKEDCIDCYASPLTTSKSVKKSKPKMKSYGIYEYEEKIVMPVLNRYIAPVISNINNGTASYKRYSAFSIQVGAFRKYGGAKRYKRRYNALSSKYRVNIKTVQKKNKPLYKVHITGFKSRVEAKIFRNKYNIKDAFLVRK